MTEREALEAAREHVLDALAALGEFPGDSRAADEAWWMLYNIQGALGEGLESLAAVDDTG